MWNCSDDYVKAWHNLIGLSKLTGTPVLVQCEIVFENRPGCSDPGSVIRRSVLERLGHHRFDQAWHKLIGPSKSSPVLVQCEIVFEDRPGFSYDLESVGIGGSGIALVDGLLFDPACSLEMSGSGHGTNNESRMALTNDDETHKTTRRAKTAENEKESCTNHIEISSQSCKSPFNRSSRLKLVESQS
jgi:hypothetical protein